MYVYVYYFILHLLMNVNSLGKRAISSIRLESRDPSLEIIFPMYTKASITSNYDERLPQ